MDEQIVPYQAPGESITPLAEDIRARVAAARMRGRGPSIESSRDNWLVFGVSSPERRFLGSRFNIGSAVLDVFAPPNEFSNQGPIRSALIEVAGRSVRLVKPNVMPEMASDAAKLAHSKCQYGPGCVILVYGDPDFPPGIVAARTKGGSGGVRIAGDFLRVFGKADVIRIRVGIGKLPPLRAREQDVLDDGILQGIQIAAKIVKAIVADGYTAGVDMVKKANHGKALI